MKPWNYKVKKKKNNNMDDYKMSSEGKCFPLIWRKTWYLIQIYSACLCVYSVLLFSLESHLFSPL